MPSSVGRVAKTTIKYGLVGSGLLGTAYAFFGLALGVMAPGGGIVHTKNEEELAQLTMYTSLLFAATGGALGVYEGFKNGAAVGLFVGVVREIYHNEPAPVRQAIPA